MELADKGLNPQAEALEEAQTKIRIAVRDGYFNRYSKAVINAEVQRIIRGALNEINLPALQSAAVRSLNLFAERQYNALVRMFGVNPIMLLAVKALVNNEPDTAEYRNAARTVSSSIEYTTQAKGVPLQEFAEDYSRRVVKAIDDIARQNALDPDDETGRNSLRNRAEMEVRYNDHLEQIDNLRAAGVKLVTSSVHADCSDRCYPWQGKVYSLDGTSGTTEDGKPYIPLERATDIYYTTKAGRTYKNGLLGFNCRHYLMPYMPRMVIPHVSREQQQKERAINTRQRELEREVREWRSIAIERKAVNREEYLKARRNAIEANKAYIQFSKENGRAYYPSRTKLL